MTVDVKQRLTLEIGAVTVMIIVVVTNKDCILFPLPHVNDTDAPIGSRLQIPEFDNLND